MKYPSMSAGVIAVFIHTLSVSSGAAGSTQRASGQGVSGTAQPAVVSVSSGKFHHQPPASSLSDKGYYYRYQGKKVQLLKVNDQVGITYRTSAPHTEAGFKRKQRFSGSRFRTISKGKRHRELMTLDATATPASGAQTADDRNAKTVAELKTDTSVAYVSPVYFNPNTGRIIVLTDGIVVKFSPSADASLHRRVASIIDGVIEREIMPSVYTFRCSTEGESDMLLRCRSLENVTGVEWAEPEMLFPVKKHFTPDDPLLSSQWHLENTGHYGATAGADMQVTDAWDIRQMGDSSISIAILDDGVDTNHADILFKEGGYDFYNDDAFPVPATAEDNHGTACAGVAAAIGNNGIGVAGVAAGAKILPIKIWEALDFLSYTEIASAVTWTYEQGADVLSNSWGGVSVSNVLTTAIRNASTLGRDGKGCPVFVSSGNDASTFFPVQVSFSGNNQYAIAFVYEKNGSLTDGDDRVAVDNIVIYGADGNSIVMSETFSDGAIPSDWSTTGGESGSDTPVSGIAGWSSTTDVSAGGFGDQTSVISGSIGNSQWSELRMPLRPFQAGQRLAFHASVSTEGDADILKIRYYSSTGTLISESIVASGIAYSEPTISFPASADSAIAVGASTDQDFRSYYSQYDVSGTGKTVDFLAPSGGGWNGIFTTDRTGTDGYSEDDYNSSFSGTSASCPAAAGVAALILSHNPYLSRNKVLEVMRTTCDKIGDVTYTDGINNEYGYGRLNAFSALANLPPAITGQNTVATTRNNSVTLTSGDLIIFDTETPDGPFTLTVYGGSNYTFSGSTVTPATDFTGMLSVPVTVDDGTYTSDQFTLSIEVRATNSVPSITAQSTITILEDGSYDLTADDLSITDNDDAGPFSITSTSSSGSNYTIVNNTVQPDADFNGTLTVPVTVSDGIDDSDPFDLIITVSPVNDAPSFTPGGDVTVNEDHGSFTQGNWATAISSGPSNESAQSRAFIVSSTNGGLFSTVPRLSMTGDLSFTTAPDANGVSTVTIRMYDDGGTSDGGVDSTGPLTFTITISPVNDAPSFAAGAPVAVNEDAGAQTIAGWATAIISGPSDEAGQSVNFSVVAAYPDLFSVQPDIAEDGTLSFTPAANHFGNSDITIILADDGGTDNGGTDTSAEATVTITINPVNDAPSFTPGSNVTVNEDAPAQSIAWATAISEGLEESSQSVSFSLLVDDPDLFSSLPSITASGQLSFTPAVNVSGVTSVSVRLHDNGGTDRNGIDTSDEATFSITILAVNDPPTFIAGSQVTVSEDAGPQSLTGWAAIGAGASDEPSQSVAVSLTISDATLFSGIPTLSEDGTFSFTPAPDQSGSTTLTPMLTDDGGTSNGGVNSTTGSAFTITITPVNDPPSFTAGGDIQVYEDTGACTIPDWATSLNPGPDESDQQLTFAVSTENTTLFSTLPALDDQGNLTFTPADDANGSALVTVRLHDDGGTADDGVDSSASVEFAITVTAVNDLPQITIDGLADLTLGEESVITVTASDPDGITPDLSTGTLPAWVSFATVAGSGTATLTCTPQTDTGSFSITVTADDLILPVDTIIELRVHAVPTGAIEVIGAPSSASIGIYATAGWIGSTVLTGPGRITGLEAGTYLLSVTDPDFRTEYYSSEVVPSTIDTISVSLRPPVAVALNTPDTLEASDGRISAGELVSAVIDDADNDGWNDVLLIGTSGRISICKGTPDSYTAPDLLHTVNSGKTALRCLDWNEDGINDLLTVNIIGSVRIALGTGPLQYRNDSTLLITDAGCTGVELVPNSPSEKGFYFGFADGTVDYTITSAGTQPTAAPVVDDNGTPVDVGDNANVVAFDITGDGARELLIGNSSGRIEVFERLSPDRIRSLGILSADGAQLTGRNGIMLSSTFGDPGELPSIVYSDGDGRILRADGKPCGDINNDGTVDILDLQQLGIHWGQQDTDPDWSGTANLQFQTTGTRQEINVLDLQILANYWGVQR